jgi:hypothetical protein
MQIYVCKCMTHSTSYSHLDELWIQRMQCIYVCMYVCSDLLCCTPLWSFQCLVSGDRSVSTIEFYSFHWAPGSISPRVNRPGREADNSPSTSAKVNMPRALSPYSTLHNFCGEKNVIKQRRNSSFKKGSQCWWEERDALGINYLFIFTYSKVDLYCNCLLIGDAI